MHCEHRILFLAVNDEKAAEILSRIDLALFHPRLLSHLILIEPVLDYCTPEGVYFAHFAVQKPHTWTSRSVADAYLRKSSPFSTWDERVREKWLDFGLMQESESSDQLKLVTSKHQEAVTYVRPLFVGGSSMNKEHSEATKRKLFPDFDESKDGFEGFYTPLSVRTFQRLPELPKTPLRLWRKELDVPVSKTRSHSSKNRKWCEREWRRVSRAG